MIMKSEKGPRYFNQSLARGLTVLQSVAGSSDGKTLTEVSADVGFDKATVKRLLFTLQKLNFVQVKNEKFYEVTPRVLSLGYSAICNLEWREIAKYYLQQLYDDIQENISLSILDGGEIIYVLRIVKKKYLPIDIRIGSRMPVYAPAMGKVLMAFGKKNETQKILDQIEFRPINSHTVDNLDRFKKQLAAIRTTGYALCDQELIVSSRAIAAPVMHRDNYAAAAIAISVPSTEYSIKDVEAQFSEKILATARLISDALNNVEAEIGVEN